MKVSEILESKAVGEYVYHASFLPNLRRGLISIQSKGLLPSKDGQMGPGVYFAYSPDDTYYHVSKDEATMFRAKWADLVKRFGVYPSREDGIQRDDEQIIVPDTIPADLLEVEYFPGEFWEIPHAIAAESITE